MVSRSLIPALLLTAAGAFCQAPDLAPDSVRIVSEKRVAGADLVEWVYTLDCRAGGSTPSLRVTLGRQSSNASAGVAMAVGADDRASGTITVRVQTKDKEARTCALTVEVGPENSAVAGQTIRLPPGLELTTVADLRSLPAAQLRRTIPVGNVGGCMISAYVMPGRAPARDNPLNTPPPPPGDPALLAADALRAWVRGVKSGELESFSAAVPPTEWQAMDTAQRTRRLQEYQEAFKTVLGDAYNPDDFKVDYTGGPSAGRLKIRYGDKELPDLNIRYVGGKWVFSEP